MSADQSKDAIEANRSRVVLSQDLLKPIGSNVPGVVERPVLQGALKNRSIPSDAQFRFARADQELQNAETQEAVVEAALQICSLLVDAAAFFLVHRGIVQGYKGSGFFKDYPLQGIVFPLHHESFLTRVVQEAKSILFNVSNFSAQDRKLLQAMGRKSSPYLLLLPIFVRGRTVSILYVDCSERGVSDLVQKMLAVLVDQVGKRYEELILKNKQPST